MFDFHTHTFLSDGVLAPIELIRRAIHAGYRAMAITDHVGPGNAEFILKTLIADCKNGRQGLRVSHLVEFPQHVPSHLQLLTNTALPATQLLGGSRYSSVLLLVESWPDSSVRCLSRRRF